MLSRASIAAGRRLYALASHNVGVTAVCCQSTAASTAQVPAADPIQKMFVDKIHEYVKKSKAAGGKMVDASPVTEKAMTDELEKLARQYGAKGADFSKFPTFTFADPKLQPVGVSVEIKQAAQAAEAEEEEDDDRPFYEAP
jgi:hypothetical protein